jgi:hypothetical protein
MDRRNFLTGLVTSVAGLSVGLKMTAPLQGEVIEPGKSLIISPHDVHAIPLRGDFIYNAQGKILGIVTNLVIEHRMMESTHAMSSHKEYYPGLRDATLTAQLMGPMDLVIGDQKLKML